MKYFFPVENSHFGRPKTNFRRFQKWKAKKTNKQTKKERKKQTNKQTNKQTKTNKTKQNKKKSSPLFITFPTSISNFPPSLLQFSFFYTQLSPLFPFSLPLFSRYFSKNFPVRSLGELCPPAPPPDTPLTCRHVSIVGWGRDWWLSLYNYPPSQVQGNKNGKKETKQNKNKNKNKKIRYIIFMWMQGRISDNLARLNCLVIIRRCSH